MSSIKGTEVKIELTRQGKTQRWLIDELAKRGYTNLDEPLFSRILSGQYPWKLGRDVIALSFEILGISTEAKKEAV